MKSTHFEGRFGLRLPRQVQLQRVRRAVEEELTPMQRQTLIAYYFQEKTVPQIAAERGVQKSTVSRTLHRAERRLQRCLRY